jgi:hypothetical protein
MGTEQGREPKIEISHRRPGTEIVCRPSALRILFQKLHGVADGEDRFGSIVGDLASELFLECHHQFHGIETVHRGRQ